EYASLFAALGVKVTLIERTNMLLGFLDDELSGLLVRRFVELGIEVRFRAEVTGVTVDGGAAGGGAEPVRVRLADGSELRAERLLCALGRAGATAGLGLDRIGVTPDRFGKLAVDEHYRIAGARGGRVYAA